MDIEEEVKFLIKRMFEGFRSCQYAEAEITLSTVEIFEKLQFHCPGTYAEDFVYQCLKDMGFESYPDAELNLLWCFKSI